MAGVHPLVGSSQPDQEGPPIFSFPGGPSSYPIAPVLWNMPRSGPPAANFCTLPGGGPTPLEPGPSFLIHS
jgi:hypothetical protein